jgi:hypothetical protein
MAFMEPETYHGDYYVIDSTHGTTFLPVDVHPGARTNADLADYVEGTIEDADDAPIVCSGWLARLSASGYMDCTSWTWYDAADEDEAIRMLCDDEDICATCYEAHDEDEGCNDANATV